jgi:hypothetical protein
MIITINTTLRILQSGQILSTFLSPVTMLHFTSVGPNMLESTKESFSNLCCSQYHHPDLSLNHYLLLECSNLRTIYTRGSNLIL